MLDKHPGRSLLWLDADSRVRRFPTLFDNFPHELGVHEIDWGLYTSRGSAHKHIANAVIYVKNTDKIRTFLRKWIKFNLMNPHTFEQKNMEDVLYNTAIGKAVKWHNLPPQYCQIFDLMKEAGDPVIEQMQASRELKNATLDIASLKRNEKDKYTHIWKNGYKSTACSASLAEHFTGLSYRSPACSPLCPE